MSGKGEFDFIARQLAPLSAGYEGAFNLSDDAALLTPPKGRNLVVTTDTLIEGRHFPFGDDPKLATRKALRVSLSDLAAMGAEPWAYMTCVVWPLDGREQRLDGFIEGLKTDQSQYGIHLIGGDTTQSNGPWNLTITAFGHVPIGQCVRRAGAKPGDEIWVTGTIGDACLELDYIKNGRQIPDPSRLRLPRPRIELASSLLKHAHAAIDVSDGVLADTAHIARNSSVDIILELGDLPLSQFTHSWVERQAEPSKAFTQLATGGDDYELVISIAPEKSAALTKAAAEQNIAMTQIGRVVEGDGGLKVYYENNILDINRLGFTHF